MEQDIEKKLKKYSLFETKEDVEKFDELLSQIAETKNPEYIPLFMEIFDDNTEFPEVMYNVVHALEYYPEEIHNRSVIEFIPFMLIHAPEWLLTLVYRIFNNPPFLALFKKNIHLIPKESMVQLIDLVEQESEYHRDICTELRQLLKNESLN